MFFLGITGSLLPYILLTGVILVFTLETNKDILAESVKLPSGKTIELEAQHHVNEELANCYLFSFKGNKKDSKQISDPEDPEDTKISRFLYKKSIAYQSAYFKLTLKYNAPYFGLSPPVSIT